METKQKQQVKVWVIRRGQVWDQMWVQVRAQMRAQVQHQVWRQVWRHAWWQVRDQIEQNHGN